MFRRQAVVALLVLAFAAACAAPAASPSATASGTPAANLPSPTGSPSRTPTAPQTPSSTRTPATPSPTIATRSPSPTPATTTVRAYFLLRDGSGGEVVNEPTLVPVLRTMPRSAATATAAMEVLLAGPSAKERAALPPIQTVIPVGSKLLGIEVAQGLATVDLSATFATFAPADAWDLGSFSLRGRLAQVVYTLTQFPSVDRVNFKIDGKPVRVLFGMASPDDGSSEAIALDKPVTRATYREHFLPLIFVDGPAWGAALPNPGRVTGLANVDEAQFRIAVLDRDGKSLVDVPVVATCGTGCWGRFDVTLSYDVSSAQWGSLRVWDISEYSGRPMAVRAYPVYLRPAP